MTEKQIETLARLIKSQIEKPTRAVVNCEGAFVKDKLHAAGENELAKEYWSWICSGARPGWFPPEIDALQDVLKKIDAGVSMPAWGTYGT